jgi:hypothetical protein
MARRGSEDLRRGPAARCDQRDQPQARDIHGAALFCTLAARRSEPLLRLLVACQIMWDFLDSASESAFALLALASDPDVADEDVASVHRIYWPWACILATLLDSYVDTAEDAAVGDHSCIAYYPNRDVALERIAEIVRRSLANAAAAPDGERHVVVIACMVAMYLSKDTAHVDGARLRTRALLARSGLLPRVLLPLLRLWRLCYGQRAA